MPFDQAASRRRFLQFLAASPLYASGILSALAGEVGAFRQAGVERVLELMRAELYGAMQQISAPPIKHLVPAMVRRA